jgi:hypothetical protein
VLRAVSIGPEELRLVSGRHHPGHMIHYILVSGGLKEGCFVVEMSRHDPNAL